VASIEELEQRLAAVEARLGMEAGLRASPDRDLASLAANQRAANHLLQALSITQSEHTQTLAGHTQTLAEHTRLLNAHTEMLNALDQGIKEILRRLPESSS
jgi:hypothetical protein